MKYEKYLNIEERNPCPCDSCLVGWCAISNQGTKSCQDTCVRWKEYWKGVKFPNLTTRIEGFENV